MSKEIATKPNEHKASKVIYEELSKDEKILFQEKILLKQFSKLDIKTKNIVKVLIKNAAFMSVQLEFLKDHITKNGVITEYKNGDNQYGTKKSPEAEMYNTMIKNISSIIKQLCELVPRDIGAQKDDGFDDFVKKR